ncbi:carboxypeptidase regulatory-like domain-containing protein [Candidatus Fermentibacteria bacterium]|nr:carboxypeptidase regulatory-like domain-containing protein [Candidatus Fermentibacteria bacterium]
MRVVRVALLLCVMLVVMAPQCSEDETRQAQPAPSPTPTEPVTLYGVVRGSPPRGMPPSETPSLGSTVPDALVALHTFSAREDAAGEVVVSTRTDSVGAYRLQAPPGTYYLAVSHAMIPYTSFTQGYMDKSFAPEDSIQTFRILEVSADQEENIIVPQRWPQ